MKTAIFLTLSLIFTQAFAASSKSEIPNCWTESGMKLWDGQFNLSMDVTKVSGLELAALLEKMQVGNLAARRFPSVFGSEVNVLIESVDWSNKLSRSELKSAVEEQLKAILESGVGINYIECNGAEGGPSPGVTVHN